MSDPAAEVPDASQGPVTDRTQVPVPRLATPATESPDASLRAEAEAVGDEPDTGGLPSPDHAQ